MKLERRQLLRLGLVLVLLGAGFAAWWLLRAPGLADGLTRANGRIEATEVDVASKLAGRLEELRVDEGDFVEQGQVLARMDTQVLQAQLAQARAQQRQAVNAVDTARAQVALREAEKTAAHSLVAQRQAELTAAQKRHTRTATLVKRNALPQQQLDDDVAALQSSQAALAASRAQVLSAEAAIQAAKSQVIEAESAVEAAAAAVARLQADIDDSQLKAPRSGRVQYRISQAGEVLGAGGRVLNLVDLDDVYMTVFLPAHEAGRLALGSDARLIIDAAPQYVIPAKISYVASVAQFTPKTVETASEREKLMFRVRARIDPELLRRHLQQVKTGVPGVAYFRLDPQQDWPQDLQVKVPQ